MHHSICLEMVSKSYGARKVVDGLSFTVSSGECFVLLGPSGGGKTTTLRLIAGLESPDQGNIVIDGVLVSTQRKCVKPPQSRKLAMVFQDMALWPHMNVKSNISFAITSRKNRRQLTSEILCKLKLDHLASRFPYQLSGGEQQRVAIGRAIASQPKILLLDEPFSNLDTVIAQELRDEVIKLHQQLNFTLIWVTHDVKDAILVADRIGVIKDGRLLQTGTFDELYSCPVSLCVASLTGEAFFLQGEWTGSHEVLCILGKINVKSEGTGRAWIVIRPYHLALRLCGTYPCRILRRFHCGNVYRYEVQILSEKLVCYSDIYFDKDSDAFLDLVAPPFVIPMV